MPESCATTKLDKDLWLNVFRRGLKNLDAVLNRLGKSEISVLNRAGFERPSCTSLPKYPLSAPPTGVFVVPCLKQMLNNFICYC